MKKTKILISIILLITFSILCLSIAADYKYVGSKTSNKYHYPNCKLAKKILPELLVTFQSANEALAARYIPCKVCRPPTKDQGDFSKESIKE
jgi:methylphosphotriester-DNA--protein-cysteine methyltransferase